MYDGWDGRLYHSTFVVVVHEKSNKQGGHLMVRHYDSTSRLSLTLYGWLLVGCHKTLRAYNLVACLLYMLITPREDFKLLLRKDFGSFTLWWSLIISSLLSLAPPPHS